MAYDEGLAERLREVFPEHAGIAEKKMFGGLCFLARGHMFVGIVGEALMARVGPVAYEKALRRPHARVMDFTGKPMKGYVYVAMGYSVVGEMINIRASSRKKAAHAAQA